MSVSVVVPDSVIGWLTHGRRGISSETILTHLYGIPFEQRPDHPYDTADVGRCIRLLDACPEVRARFEEMRTASTTWAAYVDAWPTLENLYRRGDGPGVYALCKQIRAGDAR